MNLTKTTLAIALAVNLWLAPVSYAQGIEYYPIVKIGGSVPQAANKPSNAIDGDLATRWSGQWKENTGMPELVIDLGEELPVNIIEISWHEGASRSYYFTVELFIPALGFLNVGGGESERLELQSHVLLYGISSRFVRIRGIGSDHPRAKTAEWTSISEIRIGYDPTQDDGYSYCVESN